MQNEEVDIAIKELELRLERLRSLYEQYFMGMERTAPAVAHKDVERRLQVLKKTRFKNTAKRFKFQTIAQRYNTMQQYWTRICREIEEGRYRRHRLKAERTVGALAALRQQERDEEEAAQAREHGAQARQELEADLSELLQAEQDGSLDRELDRALGAITDTSDTTHETTRQSPPVQEVSPPKSGLLGRLGRRTDPNASLRPELTVSRPPEAGAARPAPTAAQRPPTAPTRTTGTGQSGASRQPTAPGGQSGSPARPGTPGRPSSVGQPDSPGRPAAAGQRPATTSEAGLSAERIKQLHQSYVAARKQTNASSVSYEKLERSLRDTEQKLRQKHKGKNVDFDVVVKDGRAILKPKLR